MVLHRQPRKCTLHIRSLVCHSQHTHTHTHTHTCTHTHTHTHFQPYEPLLIACCGGRSAGPSVVDLPPSATFVSVPSPQHSRKPVLADLLGPLACHKLKPGDIRLCKSELMTKRQQIPQHCLELFGRNLLPGWTTWGNDVLRFQGVDERLDGLVLSDKCGWCQSFRSHVD